MSGGVPVLPALALAALLLSAPLAALPPAAGDDGAAPPPRPPEEPPSPGATLFRDLFAVAGAPDPANWSSAAGAAVDSGCASVSSPYSLHLNSADAPETKALDLSGAPGAHLGFWVRTGGPGPPNCWAPPADDILAVEYWNGSAWACLLLLDPDGTNSGCPAGSVQSWAGFASQSDWAEKRLDLPAGALRAGVKFRFRSSVSCCDRGWGIDDVHVWTGSPPAAPAQVSPFDHQRGGPDGRRPRFEFSASDPEGDRVRYRIQLDTDPAFASPDLDATSGTATGFYDVTNPGETDPFPSGDLIRFTPPADLADSTVHHWRVRASDLNGPDGWGAWASPGDAIFAEDFDTGRFDSKWDSTNVFIDGTCGSVSGSSALHIQATNREAPNATVMSAPIDLSSLSAAAVSFWIVNGGGSCTGAAGTLTFSYLNSSGGWSCLAAFNGACTGGAAITPTSGWMRHVLPLPPDALWSGTRLRFLINAGGIGADRSYTVDSIFINRTGGARSFAVDSTVATARWNQTSAAQFARGTGEATKVTDRQGGAAEYSPLRFADEFGTLAMDYDSRWEYRGSSEATPGNTCSYAPSSPPYALEFGGSISARTRPMDLGFASAASLEFWYRAGDGVGGCGLSGSNEELFFDYWSAAQTWVCAQAFDPDGFTTCAGPTDVPLTAWGQVSVSLPAGALWDGVQFRIRSTAFSGNYAVDSFRVVVTSAAKQPAYSSPAIRFSEGPPGPVAWQQLSWTEYEDTGARVNVTVQTNPSPNCSAAWAWSGLKAPSPPISLATIAQTPCIRPIANLSAPGQLSAALLDWEVTWATAPAPAVLGTSPADGAVGVALGSAVAVRFTLDMEPNSTAAAFSISPAVPNSTASVAGKDLTWTHADDFKPLTAYSARIDRSAKSQQGVPIGSDYPFSFTTGPAAPRVLSTTPANGTARVAVDAVISVEFSEVMEPASTAAAFSIAPAVAGGNASVAGRNLTWSHSQAFAYATVYRVAIAASAKSASGANLSSPHAFELTTVPPRPRVVATDPATGSTGVAALEAVIVYFDLDMDPASTAAAWSITPDPGGGVSTISGKRLIWTHAAQFSPAGKHTVTIAGSARSAAGEEMGSPHTFDFTTATAPRVLSVSPAGVCGSAGVDRTVSLAFSFTEPMNESATSAALSVDPPVPGTSVSWSLGALRWSPPGPLAANTSYNARIFASARSAAGFPLDPEFSCTFTTGDGAGGRPPRVVSTSPQDGETGVALDANVIVRFDSEMNMSTTGAAFSIAPGSGAVIVSVVGRNLTMSHISGQFVPGTEYVVRIAPSASSTDGTAMGVEFSFSFRTAGTAPPPGPEGPAIRTVEALIILLSILVPLVVLLFLFTRRRKKKEEQAKVERKEVAEAKPEPASAEDVPPPPPDEEPPTKVHEERHRKPKKDPKEINPWGKLEE